MSIHFRSKSHRRRLVHAAAIPPPDWTPADLGTLVSWWDFSDASTLFTDAGVTPVSSDGDRIYQANDKEGSNNLVQTTLNRRANWKTGIQNGLSIARFVDDGWNMRYELAFTIEQPTTMVVAFHPKTGQTGDRAFWDGHSVFSGLARTDNADAQTLELYAGAFLTNGTITYNVVFSTWAIIWDGVSSKWYEDGGSALASGNAGANDMDGLKLGLSGVLMDVGEIVICSSALSTTDLDLLGDYLYDKWQHTTWTDAV